MTAPGGRAGEWLPAVMRELQLILAGRLCEAVQQQQCAAEDQEFAGWACSQCREGLRVEQVSDWSWHLLRLYQLQEAGYPFRANDLSLDTWLILGWLRQGRQKPEDRDRYEKAQ